MAYRPSALEPKWLLVIVFFIAGIFLGWISSYLYLSQAVVGGIKIYSHYTYKWINPLLAVDLAINKQALENKPFETEFRTILANAQKNDTISDGAIYFRDIEPGYWTGINEEANFSPGKLLKIPIMIAYFKLAESNPEILNEEYVFHGPNVSAPYFEVEEALVDGERYTVNDLLRRMITNYDDDTANLLFDHINKPLLNEVFSDLGINFKETKDSPDFISLKLYSLFFRILYNSTYLNREFSERALDLLVKSRNDIGLSAGMPKDIPIANRVGARKYGNNFEMYDCGISYYPRHPYLLCAAVHGKNLENIKDFMKVLGQRVYTEVDYKYKNR